MARQSLNFALSACPCVVLQCEVFSLPKERNFYRVATKSPSPARQSGQRPGRNLVPRSVSSIIARFSAGSERPLSGPDAASSLWVGCRLLDAHDSDPKLLDFNSFRDREGILQIKAKVFNCAVHLCVSEQKLNCAKVAGLPENLRYLRSSHRVRTVSTRL